MDTTTDVAPRLAWIEHADLAARIDAWATRAGEAGTYVEAFHTTLTGMATRALKQEKTRSIGTVIRARKEILRALAILEYGTNLGARMGE